MDRDKIIKGLECCTKWMVDNDINACDNCPYHHEYSDFDHNCIEMLNNDILALLKEKEAVVHCKDCKNWIPGYITDQDDFIPPKCWKYQQMVGHSADDFCSLAEKQEGR